MRKKWWGGGRGMSPSGRLADVMLLVHVISLIFVS